MRGIQKWCLLCNEREPGWVNFCCICPGVQVLARMFTPNIPHKMSFTIDFQLHDGKFMYETINVYILLDDKHCRTWSGFFAG